MPAEHIARHHVSAAVAEDHRAAVARVDLQPMAREGQSAQRDVVGGMTAEGMGVCTADGDRTCAGAAAGSAQLDLDLGIVGVISGAVGGGTRLGIAVDDDVAAADIERIGNLHHADAGGGIAVEISGGGDVEGDGLGSRKADVVARVEDGAKDARERAGTTRRRGGDGEGGRFQIEAGVDGPIDT